MFCRSQHKNLGNMWEHWEQAVFMRVRAFPTWVQHLGTLGTKYLFQLMALKPVPTGSQSVPIAWEQKGPMFMQLFPLFPTEKNEPLEVPLVHPRKITQHFASESLRNQHVRIGRTKNGASNPTGAAGVKTAEPWTFRQFLPIGKGQRDR